MTIDLQTFTAATPDGNTVDVLSGTITLDETRVPYIAATIVIVKPDDVSAFDPRLDVPPRCVVTAAQSYGDPLEVSELGGTVAGLFSGSLPAMTAALAHPYTPGNTLDPSRRTFDLLIRRTLDREDGTLELTLTSDEAGLMDEARFAPQFDDTPQAGNAGAIAPTNLVGLVNWMLAQYYLPARTLVEATIDRDLSAFEGEDASTSTGMLGGIWWPAGTTLWEFAEPFLQLADARLWADEHAQWHLTPDTTALSYSTRLTDPVEVETIDREDEWANTVTVIWTWIDPGSGLDHSRVDFGSSAPIGLTYVAARNYTKRITVENPKHGFVPPIGMAQQLAQHLAELGLSRSLEARNDLTVQPGCGIDVFKTIAAAGAEVARNAILNPVFGDSSLSSWPSYNVTSSSFATTAPNGTKIATIVGAAGGSGLYEDIAVLGGSTWSFGVDVTAAADGVRLFLEIYDAAGNGLGNPTAAHLGDGQLTQLTIEGLRLPAAAAKVRVGVQSIAAPARTYGVANVMAVQAPELPPRFAGSTPSDEYIGGFAYQWTGPPNASASVKRELVPVQQIDYQAVARAVTFDVESKRMALTIRDIEEL